MTETLIVAIITAVGTILGAWWAASSVVRKGREDAAAIVKKAAIDAETAADALYAQLCRDQQARIKDLVGQIHANETRVTTLEEQARGDRMRISLLEQDNDRLSTLLAGAQEQIDKLEQENESLRAALKAFQKAGPMPARRVRPSDKETLAQ